MKKKAMELPINVIIIAGIGLAILIIFFIVFTSEAGEFSKTILTCEGKGGQCINKGTCEYQTTGWQCPKKEFQECCVNPLSR